MLILKHLLNVLKKIQQQICDQKRTITTTLVSAFFEFKTLFKNIFSVTALTLLKQYPSFKKIASLKPENLVKLFRNIKGNNFNYQKALKIIETAKKLELKLIKKVSELLKNTYILLLLLQSNIIMNLIKYF